MKTVTMAIQEMETGAVSSVEMKMYSDAEGNRVYAIDMKVMVFVKHLRSKSALLIVGSTSLTDLKINGL